MTTENPNRRVFNNCTTSWAPHTIQFNIIQDDDEVLINSDNKESSNNFLRCHISGSARATHATRVRRGDPTAPPPGNPPGDGRRPNRPAPLRALLRHQEYP
eukprot:1193947-Prorocentrum_minimum.AAC.2